MARGRRPKPTQLKVVEGTHRKDRANGAEPEVAAARPAAPAHLNDPAKEEWARVVDMLFAHGIVTELDRAALAAYCQAYGRWVLAEDALSKFSERDKATHGIIMKTQQGNAVQNPLVGAANKAMADLVRYAAEFGMTPSARARVRADDGGKKDDPASRFFGG